MLLILDKHGLDGGYSKTNAHNAYGFVILVFNSAVYKYCNGVVRSFVVINIE